MATFGSMRGIIGDETCSWMSGVKDSGACTRTIRESRRIETKTDIC